MSSFGMNVGRFRTSRLIPKSGFVRNVTMLASGTGLGQALFVLASPLLTRIYTPEDFGALAVYTSMLAMSVIAATWRYELAIPLPEDDTTAADLLALCLGIAVTASCVAALLVLVLGDHISDWTNSPALRPYLWLLPIGIMVSSTFQTFNFWAIRHRRFAQLATAKFSHAVGTLIVQLGLGVLALRPLGLLLGQVVGRATGTGLLARVMWQKDLAALRCTNLQRVRWVAKRYVRFAMFSTPAAFLTTAWLQIPALLLATFYGPEVAGWFALGQLCLGAPIMLLGDSVGEVYVGEAARLARETPKQLYSLFLNTAGRIFLLGLVPIGVVALGGSELFKFAFGDSWGEAGIYVRLLAAMFLLRLAVAPVSRTLSIIERQDLFLILSVARFLMILGAFLLAHWLDFTPTTTIAFYSANMCIIYIANFLLVLWALRKHLDRVEHRA